MAKQPSSSTFSVFQAAGGLPPGLFGETYAIATARKVSPRVYEGEFFLLTQRPKASLEQGAFVVNAANIPDDVLVIDLAFVLQEFKQQAEVRLIDLLYKRAKELKRPDLVALSVSLVEMHYRPFVGCWLRDSFRPQIRAIAKATKEPSLRRYMAAIASMV